MSHHLEMLIGCVQVMRENRAAMRGDASTLYVNARLNALERAVELLVEELRSRERSDPSDHPEPFGECPTCGCLDGRAAGCGCACHGETGSHR